MLDRRLFFIFFTITLFVSVINAERARNDNLQDDFIDDNSDDNEYVIDAIKRFLGKKKTTTTTGAPNTGAISALITATPKGRVKGETTRSSILDPFGKDRKTLSTTTSRYSRTRATSGPVKEACGVISPCKNGGTCKTLSSGKYYCFCAQDYYGKTCENSMKNYFHLNSDLPFVCFQNLLHLVQLILIEHVKIIVHQIHAVIKVNVLDYVQHIIVDVNHLFMVQIVINQLCQNVKKLWMNQVNQMNKIYMHMNEIQKKIEKIYDEL